VAACAADCGGVCFYCDATLSPRHEHDHFPIAKRHDGESTVPVCLNCHDLKDRIPSNNWPGSLMVQAFLDAGPMGRLLIAKCAAILADHTAEDTRNAELTPTSAPPPR
jgi:hypothetical protein